MMGLLSRGPGLSPAARPQLQGLFAQVAARGEGQERLHRRAGVGDDPLAFEALGRRRGRRGLDHVGRQSGEVVRAGQHQGLALLVAEDVLAEGGVEVGEILVDLGQALLALRRQRRALAREAVVDDDRPAAAARWSGRWSRGSRRRPGCGRTGPGHGRSRRGTRPASASPRAAPAAWRRRSGSRCRCPAASRRDRSPGRPARALRAYWRRSPVRDCRRSPDLGAVMRHGLVERRREIGRRHAGEHRRAAVRPGPLGEDGIGGGCGHGMSFGQRVGVGVGTSGSSRESSTAAVRCPIPAR